MLDLKKNSESIILGLNKKNQKIHLFINTNEKIFQNQLKINFLKIFLIKKKRNIADWLQIYYIFNCKIFLQKTYFSSITNNRNNQ